MPDENGTETTRPDAVNVEESIFGDAAEKADDAPAAVVKEEDASEETAQDAHGDADADAHDSDDAGDKPDAEGEAAPSEELKVVVSIKGGRTVIGVQEPSSDPHIETFDDHDLPALAQEVTAVTERAKARWEETPKHPAYERPAPPARRRNRRQQGTAQDATAETQEAETRQQTLRLF